MMGMAPQSPNRLSPAEAARLDKETKDKIKNEKQDLDRAIKKEKQDEAKRFKKTREDAFNNSPPGQAQKWLHGVTKDINNLNATKARLRSSDLQQGLKAEWEKVIDVHMGALNEVRATMEAVGSESQRAAPDLFTKGNGVVLAFRKDDGELKTLLNLRDKAKRKANQATKSN